MNVRLFAFALLASLLAPAGCFDDPDCGGTEEFSYTDERLTPAEVADLEDPSCEQACIDVYQRESPNAYGTVFPDTCELTPEMDGGVLISCRGSAQEYECD